MITASHASRAVTSLCADFDCLDSDAVSATRGLHHCSSKRQTTHALAAGPAASIPPHSALWTASVHPGAVASKSSCCTRTPVCDCRPQQYLQHGLVHRKKRSCSQCSKLDQTGVVANASFGHSQAVLAGVSVASKHAQSRSSAPLAISATLAHASPATNAMQTPTSAAAPVSRPVHSAPQVAWRSC